MARESTCDSKSSGELCRINTFVRGIPADVFDGLDRRAKENFRCRNGEIVAILTAVCRMDIKLPLVQIGETVPTASVGESVPARI